MKKLLVIISVFMIGITGQAQNFEFFDDFESGTGNWILTGTWGLTTNAYTGAFGLSESPIGNYPDQTTMTATMDTTVDLSQALDADVMFNGTFSIEFGFDYMYLQASLDGGTTWVTLESFHGDSTWWKYTYSLGGFVGSNNVKCRFKFVSDQALNFDGMSIDNFLILSYTQDQNPPLIVHYPLPHYEGSLHEHQVPAEIFDISGVNYAYLQYWVDGVTMSQIPGTNYYGNNWLFEVPTAPAGALVNYIIVAQDASTNANTAVSDTFTYVAGNYINYDNGNVNFVGSIYPFLSMDVGAAVRVSLNDTTTLKTLLIRNYTDSNNPNFDMEVHVWDTDTAGLPGNDLITPFMATPAANAAEPHKMTLIDMRGFGDTLAGISGDIFIGIKAPLGSVHLVQSSPSHGNRTYVETFQGWALENIDYHFRAITSEMGNSPIADFAFDTVADPLVSFYDSSQGNPTAWHWDFDDGGNFSTDQNPSYAFTQNGVYNVCLTIDNGITTNTNCKYVTVDNVQAPIADFYYITTYSPEILFVDTSLNYPTSWHWDFDDNGASWNYLNPMYTFSTNDTFHVCLIVENAMGSDTTCQDIIIDDYTAPLAEFSFDPSNSPFIQFFDESSNEVYNTPNAWLWDFDDNGTTSQLADPSHLYPANGTYTVCMTASNQYGSTMSCYPLVIDAYVKPTADFEFNVIAGPEFQFIDLSTDSLTNATTSWTWDFGDGSPTDTTQSPGHTFAENGVYDVCLIAANNEGTDTICKQVTVDIYEVPVASFSINSITQPVVYFINQSIGWPTTYHWDFDDNGITTSEINPAYTFSTNDTFSVCLTVSNYLGSDTLCQNVVIGSYIPPVANFSYQVVDDTVVNFQDLSTQNPNIWFWDFDFDGQTSPLQNPTMVYPVSGTYNVCLSSTNAIGTSSAYCQSILISTTGLEKTLSQQIKVYPLPVDDRLYIDIADKNPLHLKVKLYNAIGKNTNAQTTVDGNRLILYRSNHPAGVYLLEVSDHSFILYRGKVVFD